MGKLYSSIKKYKSKGSIIILTSWLVLSSVIILKQNEEIKRGRVEIYSYSSQVSMLEGRLSELENFTASYESEKRRLVHQINEYEKLLRRGVTTYSYRSSSFIPPKRHQETFGKTEINEADVFTSKGSATVVYRQSGCDYMILENSRGFIVAEWMGGNDPDEGDRIGGEVNSYGTKEFYNTSRGSKTRLWIDDYMLSKESALEKINDKCN